MFSTKGECYERLKAVGNQGLIPDEACASLLLEMRREYWPVRQDGAGWRAIDPGSPLDGADVEAHLTTSWIGRDLRLFAEVDSTNRVGRELLAQGANAGIVLLAERQTAGRGRLERVWDSRPGLGLWFSVLLRPPSLAGAPPFALLTAVSVCQAVRAIPGVSAVLKWPNDILVNGLKTCGTLLEAGPNGFGLVAGIGLNVNHQTGDFAEALRETATSLSMACGRPVDRAGLLAAILREFEMRIERSQRSGFGPVMDEYRTLCSTIGRRVRIDTPKGPLFGTVAGVLDDGALLFSEEGERPRPIMAGDVTHLRVTSPQ